MNTSFSPSQLAWINLPVDQKEIFYNIAYKDGNPDLDGFDWFDHLVPEQLQSDPSLVETFMNGGTVTVEQDVFNYGRGGVTTEPVEFDIVDKDVSRIISGENGGEYTLDNTIMEDMSINRARGMDNMSLEEFEQTVTFNATEAEILADSSEVLSTAAETTAIATESAGALEFIGELASDTIGPVIAGVAVGTTIANHCDTTADKIGYGSMGAGAAVLVATTPVGQLGLACYFGFKLCTRAAKWLSA